MFDISSTLLVLNDVVLIEVAELSLNIHAIVVTLDVSKLDTSMVEALVLVNI